MTKVFTHCLLLIFSILIARNQYFESIKLNELFNYKDKTSISKNHNIFTTTRFGTNNLIKKNDTIPLKKLAQSNLDTLSISAVGDIMPGTNYPKTSYLPPDSGRVLFKHVLPFLQNQQIVFCNLEGTYIDGDAGTPKKCRDINKCYVFRSPKYLAKVVSDAGFDVASTANNHAGDFGIEGRNSTMAILDQLNIKNAGQSNRPYTIWTKVSVRWGFIAFSPNKGTNLIHDIQKARLQVKHLDSLCDVVLVSFHGGAEGDEYQHVTRQTETFYGENRGNVYQLAHQLINVGADVIIGHGPHVARAIELYKNRLIAYSLGNFCTYGRFNLSGPNRLAPLLQLKITSDGQFLQGQIIPFVQKYPGIPFYDSKGAVIDKIRQLSQSDFPESPLVINDKGVIKKK